MNRAEQLALKQVLKANAKKKAKGKGLDQELEGEDKTGDAEEEDGPEGSIWVMPETCTLSLHARLRYNLSKRPRNNIILKSGQHVC